jgi:hypothetical protein
MENCDWSRREDTAAFLEIPFSEDCKEWEHKNWVELENFLITVCATSINVGMSLC